jgi:hypothetical protein
MQYETLPESERTRQFTVDEANAMLPLVRLIVSDISRSFQLVTRRRSDLHRILRHGPRTSGDLYDAEIAESRADLQREYERIWQVRDELEQLGVLLRAPESGCVEFPSTMDDQHAFLSWQLGEERVAYYRRIDEPQSERHEIPKSVHPRLSKQRSSIKCP